MASVFKLCDLDAKYFTALVNGLIKRQFYRDATIDYPYLKQQLFTKSKMTDDKVNGLLSDLDRVLSLAAAEDWTIDALQKHLSQTEMSAAHTEVFKAVWKNERTKIHAGLISKSVWAGSFTTPESVVALAAAAPAGSAAAAAAAVASDNTGLSWRIDVKTTSKAQTNMNEPTAVLQLAYHKQGCATSAVAAQTPEVVRFEMDRAAVADVITKLNTIEQLIHRLG